MKSSPASRHPASEGLDPPRALPSQGGEISDRAGASFEDEPPAEPRRGPRWVAAWIWVVLGISAFFFVSFRLMLALGRGDTEASESPLMLAVARQLMQGPSVLYGPFDADNHLVLIHAPLYYHLAALVAWPLTRLRIDPVSAARISGRLWSLLGLLGTLVVAYRLARLDGAPRRAGWWAVLILAATPLLDGMPFAVRPDMLGVALQSAGVLMVLSTLRSERPRAATLAMAYAAFGLAICVKQHYVMAPLISTALLLIAWARGRISFRLIERSIPIGVGIVLLGYGLEELATWGGMSDSVFRAARHAGRVQSSDWFRVWTVCLSVVQDSLGALALLAAAGLTSMLSRPGLIRRAIGGLGTAAIGIIIALLVVQFAIMEVWVAAMDVLVVLLSLGLLLPVLALLEPRALASGQFDAVLWIYWAGESVLMLFLFRLSTGAWINYAIPSMVYLAVLVARALDRELDRGPWTWSRLPAVLAVLAVFLGMLIDVKEKANNRRVDRLEVEKIRKLTGRSPSEYFFADRPGLNRVYGRIDLVYDPWLYPVFESLGLAQPRSVWLRRALEGPVRVVVTTTEKPTIDGLGTTLVRLGYRAAYSTGIYYTWTR